MGFDNTIDNRWRPDLESSRRRVKEEESEAVIQSRELSFVPARRKAFEEYDPQTRALIAQHDRLAKLPHGGLDSEAANRALCPDGGAALTLNVLRTGVIDRSCRLP